MARVLVTGGSGYLGRHLVPLARRTLSSPEDVHYTFFQHDSLALPQAHRLDVRDGQAVARLIDALRPDAIIHAAGSNRGPDMAAVISQGTANVAHAAAAVGARLVHISTDVVFDGRQAPYAEDAPLNPIHAYGRAKAAAEAAAAHSPHHVIVRTSLIYGLQLMDHGTRWLVDDLRAGRQVTLFDNQRRNPTWVESLAQACLELAGSDFTGVLHVAGRQVLTRAQFGRRLLDWWAIQDRQGLRFEADSSGRWPLDCELDLTLAARVLATPLPGVDQVLARARRRQRDDPSPARSG